MLPLKFTGHLESVLELSSHLEATTNSKITATGNRTTMILKAGLGLFVTKHYHSKTRIVLVLKSLLCALSDYA